MLFRSAGSYLVANNSLSFSSIVIPPTTLKIFDAITIHRDGRVEIDPKYTTDEAAKLFWQAVENMAPNFLQKDK